MQETKHNARSSQIVSINPHRVVDQSRNRTVTLIQVVVIKFPKKNLKEKEWYIGRH